MMINKRNFAFLYICLCFSFTSCSKSNDSAPNLGPLWADVQPTASAVKPLMVDKNATTETAALFYNLKSYSTQGIMLGQQDAFIDRYAQQSNVYSETPDIKLTTGQNPIIVGADFMFTTNYHNEGTTASGWWYDQELLLRKVIKESYKKGLVTTISWHVNEPYNKDAFYVSEMDKIDPTLKNKAFKSILEGGENHAYYVSLLDKIAQVLSTTTDGSGKPIPVILRLFHEFDGSWFWWGIPYYATSAEFIQNWQFTVKYLRDQKGLHNVLYAFSPGDTFTSEASYTTCYPGDDYVDIIGFDNYENYGAEGTTGSSKVSGKLKILSDIAIKHKKIAALTEFGYASTNVSVTNLYTKFMYPALVGSKANIAYAMYWNNTENIYYTPTPAVNPSAATDFNNFVNMPEILVDKDVRDLYSFPVVSK